MIIKDAAGARHQILPAYAYKILKFLKISLSKLNFLFLVPSAKRLN